MFQKAFRSSHFDCLIDLKLLPYTSLKTLSFKFLV